MLDERGLQLPSAPPAPQVAPIASQALLGQEIVQQPPIPLRSVMENSTRISNNLTSMGVPFGIARLIGEEDKCVAVRIFLLDNSGSTSAFDGAHFDESGGGLAQKVPCSRWDEIRKMAIQQAAFNVAVGTPCEFVLLNPPVPRASGDFQSGMDFAAIDPARSDVHAQLAVLHQMLALTRPQGSTPLPERIHEIKDRLRRHYRHIWQEGLSAMVIVATDGLPTDLSGPSEQAKQKVVQELRLLTAEMSVFVVVRLCTDDDDVVSFYNRVDEEEELPLEVIDDLESEAREVATQGTDWFAYTSVLHMIREGGTNVKLLDLLDERRLTPLEVRLLAGHLLLTDNEPPLPLGDFRAFLREATLRVQKSSNVYNPLTRKACPVINMRKLRRAAGGVGCCRRLCCMLSGR
jgi:hypothetical protein